MNRPKPRFEQSEIENCCGTTCNKQLLRMQDKHLREENRFLKVACIILLAILFMMLPFLSMASDWKEADYVNHFCRGKVEYTLNDRTRVDYLTKTHAIEYDYAHKWAEAIGQALYYSAKTSKKAGVVLIFDNSKDMRYLVRFRTAIDAYQLPIELWTVEER